MVLSKIEVCKNMITYLNESQIKVKMVPIKEWVYNELSSRVYRTTRASNTASSTEQHVGRRKSVGEI